MRFNKLHSWNITLKEAAQVQRDLIPKLILRPLKGPVHYIAGADVSYSKKDPRLYAAVVVMKMPDMEVVEIVTVSGLAKFPYVSGFLGFREVPILLEAFRKVKIIPDVVICDGQGIAHPRRLGLAAHLGLWLDLPTVGCAKTPLIGEYEIPGKNRGEWADLTIKGEKVGGVLRTRTNVKPLFVSPGHLMDVESSLRITMQCVDRYRLPEPTRLAHIEVDKERRKI